MHKDTRKGYLAALGSSLIWGVLPIYWKSLIPISSTVITIYRIMLVFITALIIARTKYSWTEIFSPLKERRKALIFLAAGILIAANWGIYIWAVNSGHIVQSSIGYYIEPLVVCLFGKFIFKEKLTANKKIAIVLACIAVVIIIVHFHQLPTIALVMAVTFAMYKAIKSTVNEPPVISLIYETVFLAPFMLAVVIWLEAHGRGAIGVGHPYQYVLMLLCGLLTVIPLSLLASAAQNTTMSVLGLLSYVNPSIQLLIGVTVYGEVVDRVQFISFVFIWVGLVIFSYGELAAGRKEAENGGDR
jgi:chloramphenicol-sensitive protein RarD